MGNSLRNPKTRISVKSEKPEWEPSELKASNNDKSTRAKKRKRVFVDYIQLLSSAIILLGLVQITIWVQFLENKLSQLNH